MEEEAAIHLVYLVAGVDKVLLAHRIKERLTGEDEEPAIIISVGHIGMVNDLYVYAEAVATYLMRRAGADYPGVFEYEVTESLGEWLAKNWTDEEPPMLESFTAELKRQGDAFFDQ